MYLFLNTSYKKEMKKSRIITLAATLVFMFILAACGGLSQDKIEGKWITKTIDGITVEDYAASLGVDVSLCYSNVMIDDKQVTFSNTAGTSAFDYEVRSNGIELISDGEIYMSMQYDEKEDTFAYKVDLGNGTTSTYVIGH